MGRKGPIMKQKMDLKTLVATAMLAAVAGVLMSLEISLPLMPPFYKLDFSDVPSIVALFAFGPISGMAVELMKIVIKVATVGTSSMYVGEVANLIGIVLFILPTWFVYKKMNFTKKAARTSLIVSIPVRIVFSCCVNAFITLPLYASAMHISLDAVVQKVGTVNPYISSLPTFIILATIPFNLIKISLNYVVGYALYERLLEVRVFERRF